MIRLSNSVVVGWLVFCGLALSLSGEARAGDAGGQVDAASDEADEQASFSASLQQEFTPDEAVKVGEPLTLELRVTHPPGSEVRLPDTLGSARWELLNETRSEIPGEPSKTTSLTLTFGVYRPGTTTLPSFSLEVVDPQGNSRTVETKPVTARVVSVLDLDGEEPSFAGPRPAVPMWVEDYTLAWLGGIAATTFLGALLFFFLRRRELEVEVREPPRPPHEIALAKLGALAGDDLVERGQYMLFYVRLSEAIREYLGRRYGFKGTELTTTEIIEQLETIEWPAGLDTEDVADFLRHCDLVKFSGVVPTPERANKALRRAFSIVELTQPRETEKDTSAEGPEKPGGSEETAESAETASSPWSPGAADESGAEEEAAEKSEESGESEETEET